MTLEFLPKIVIAILTTAIITTIVQKILIVLIHNKIYCSVHNSGNISTGLLHKLNWLLNYWGISIYGPKQIYVPMELNFWKKNYDFIIILVLTVLNFTNNICWGSGWIEPCGICFFLENLCTHMGLSSMPVWDWFETPQ